MRIRSIIIKDAQPAVMTRLQRAFGPRRSPARLENRWLRVFKRSLLTLLLCFSVSGLCCGEGSEEAGLEPAGEEARVEETDPESGVDSVPAEPKRDDRDGCAEAVWEAEAELKHPVRILLAVKRGGVSIKAGKAATPSFNAPDEEAEKRPEGRLFVNGRGLEGRSFDYTSGEGVTTVVCSGSDGILELDGCGYRGCLELTEREGGIEVINVVALEDYLRGVVAKELLCSELEAMKAQAVAARTYALGRSGAKAGFWDLRCDTSSQVYGGVNAERTVSDRAVEQTRGLVLAYRGRLASQALYHSACGGRTESSEAVYGTAPTGYLQGVECLDPEGRPACAASPYSFWRAEWSREELGKEIAEYLGKQPQAALGIRILEGSPSGRVSRLEVILETGSAVLERGQIRQALHYTDSEGRRRSLPSLKFVIEQDGLSQDLRTDDADIPLPEAVFDKTAEAKENNGSIVIVGSGWGHGAGMCQFGAMRLSACGFSFTDILKHYYSDTEVVSIESLQLQSAPNNR